MTERQKRRLIGPGAVAEDRLASFAITAGAGITPGTFSLIRPLEYAPDVPDRAQMSRKVMAL
jgi:hypothetical protein